MNSFFLNISCECTKITVYAGTNVCVKARGQPQVSVLKFTCLRQALFGGGDSSDGGSLSSDGVASPGASSPGSASLSCLLLPSPGRHCVQVVSGDSNSHPHPHKESASTHWTIFPEPDDLLITTLN